MPQRTRPLPTSRAELIDNASRAGYEAEESLQRHDAKAPVVLSTDAGCAPAAGASHVIYPYSSRRTQRLDVGALGE